MTYGRDRTTGKGAEVISIELKNVKQVSFKVNLDIEFGEGYAPDNLIHDKKHAELAKKIFDVVVSSGDVASGARALDFAFRGLTNLQGFRDLFNASMQITQAGRKMGLLKFRVIEEEIKEIQSTEIPSQ